MIFIYNTHFLAMKNYQLAGIKNIKKYRSDCSKTKKVSTSTTLPLTSQVWNYKNMGLFTMQSMIA
jgi:hypothetical protein